MLLNFKKEDCHIAMLLHLRNEDKSCDRDDIDRIISAEIPDLNENPALRDIVKSCMIYGPCGHLNHMYERWKVYKELSKRICQGNKRDG